MCRMGNKKTLAMKLLEGKKIPYEVFAYPDGMRDAEEIAAYLGVAPEQVFKTLVVLRPKPGKPMLVMIQANRQLGLKKLAKAIGEKKVWMATHQEAEKMTGLQVGGISALALMNKGFTAFIDGSAESQDWVFVSAGQRGQQIRLAAAALINITGARVVDAAQQGG